MSSSSINSSYIMQKTCVKIAMWGRRVDFIVRPWLVLNCYEWAKRTKFLLAVIYGSPWRHSKRSKTFNLCYYNLESISLRVRKLYGIRQRSDFRNFQPFFNHNFRLRWNFLILKVSSKISGIDLLEYSVLWI